MLYFPEIEGFLNQITLSNVWKKIEKPYTCLI